MKGFLKIMEELDWPPVYLIPPSQFHKFEGDKLSRKDAWGLAAIHYPVITILTGLRGKDRDDTIYHEIAHHLWPYKPHWWIECFGQKMSGNKTRGYWAIKYGHAQEELPSRERLLTLARRQSKRLKSLYRTR